MTKKKKVDETIHPCEALKKDVQEKLTIAQQLEADVESNQKKMMAKQKKTADEQHLMKEEQHEMREEQHEIKEEQHAMKEEIGILHKGYDAIQHSLSRVVEIVNSSREEQRTDAKRMHTRLDEGDKNIAELSKGLDEDHITNKFKNEKIDKMDERLEGKVDKERLNGTEKTLQEKVDGIVKEQLRMGDRQDKLIMVLLAGLLGLTSAIILFVINMKG